VVAVGVAAGAILRSTGGNPGIRVWDGKLPICPSGGLLGVGNPIAAAGLMKICELFWQLRGEAGKRQVAGDPRTAVAQAWGDLMQIGTVVVMRS
jgi:acetyl-CoA C-acetyltransferase